MSGAFGPLVDSSWLAEHLTDPALVVLDATIAPHDSSSFHVPGARRFDIDGRLSDHSSGLPHTMPSPEAFHDALEALGIGDDSTVVAYDAAGIYSSPRAWFMLRTMGLERVAVLDGGLPAWRSAGLPVEDGPAAHDGPRGTLTTRWRVDAFTDADGTAVALADVGAVVLDARSRGRFAGVDPEPREGLRGGHMPGSLNLPFTETQADGRMLAPEALRAVFDELAPAGAVIVTSCGSGVTASVLALAAELAGRSPVTVYDGSWSEWGLPGDRPVTTGS